MPKTFHALVHSTQYTTQCIRCCVCYIFRGAARAFDFGCAVDVAARLFGPPFRMFASHFPFSVCLNAGGGWCHISSKGVVYHEQNITYTDTTPHEWIHCTQHYFWLLGGCAVRVCVRLLWIHHNLSKWKAPTRAKMGSKRLFIWCIICGTQALCEMQARHRHFFHNEKLWQFFSFFFLYNFVVVLSERDENKRTEIGGRVQRLLMGHFVLFRLLLLLLLLLSKWTGWFESPCRHSNANDMRWLCCYRHHRYRCYVRIMSVGIWDAMRI